MKLENLKDINNCAFTNTPNKKNTPPSLETILIVDDVYINRKILSKILSESYNILLAENGQSALEQIEKFGLKISAVILDLIMPIMDGYEFLKRISKNESFKNLPIIVTTENKNIENEIKALELGAWDFVSKPYNAKIIKFRLKNALERSQLCAFTRLKYIAEYDSLTNIFNKTKFFDSTQKMLLSNTSEKFVLIRFDINKFSLINTYYGTSEGDRLLKYISNVLKKYASRYIKCTYARIEADQFALCIPYYGTQQIDELTELAKSEIKQYNLNFDIVPSFGVYEINDINIPINTMIYYANLAAKQIKGNYVNNYAFYSEEISRKLDSEQEIINEMNFALEQEQFCIYLQPKYELRTNLPVGAEALVRWNHPKKGMISPGEFIPVFERNGFITKLDFYVWEKVCKLIRSWIDKGISPQPISVNISRVNLYSSSLVDTLCSLTDKYRIPRSLFNLELTESAYTDNPNAMKQIMKQLSNNGFLVFMDDFGSGYSSLNILKDIEIDVLKIDMGFLQETEIPGRGENILASIVRMAKWLNIPTIAEGVEKQAQVDFLHSIGCEYVQGYYFSRPLPVKDYEKLPKKSPVFIPDRKSTFDVNSLWANTPQMELLFSSMTQAVGIYEFEKDNIEILRVNKAFYDLFGYQDFSVQTNNPINVVKPEYQSNVLCAFYAVSRTKGTAECEYERLCAGNAKKWIRLNLKYIDNIDEKHIILCSLFDITTQKEIDIELKKYKSALTKAMSSNNKVLIIDNQNIDLSILTETFNSNFKVLTAENGKQAIEVLRKNNNNVEVILLDIATPQTAGIEFLEYKKEHPEIADIPVIIISSDDSTDQQINTLKLGADDYVVKPFVQEIVLRRVNNVLESNKRFREILHEYINIVEQAQTDPLTGIHNRTAAQEVIERILQAQPNHLHSLIMIDIDKLKAINDTYGNSYGNEIIIEVSHKIRDFFRKNDITARFEEDKFCVFMSSITSEDVLIKKCLKLCQEISKMKIGEKNISVTSSIGISVSSKEVCAFPTLFKNADIALYDSKSKGGNIATLFGSDINIPQTPKWNDKELTIDSIDDSLFIIDCETYDMIYISDIGMSSLGIETYERKKCYELLLGRTSPCPSCIHSKLNYDSYYKWSFYNDHLKKQLLLKDKLINFEGRKSHIQISVDITNAVEYTPLSNDSNNV